VEFRLLIGSDATMKNIDTYTRQNKLYIKAKLKPRN